MCVPNSLCIRALAFGTLLVVLPPTQPATAQAVRKSSGAPVEVRDSAGIVIVENPAPSQAARAFVLESTPVCTIGGAHEDPSLDLLSVPSAFRSTDGSVVVVEARTRQLRFYECSGKLRNSAGRPGDGPGEFNNLASAWRWRGDSVLVSQSFVASAAVFDPQGNFSRTIALRANILCCFDDGSVLVTRTIPARAGSERGYTAYDRYAVAAEAQLIGQVGLFPQAEVAQVRLAMPRTEGRSVTQRTVASSPFGRLTSVRPHGRVFIEGDGTSFEFRVWTREGRMRSIVRAARNPAPVSVKDIEAYKRTQLEGLQGTAAQARRAVLAAMSFPKWMPAYRRLEIDAAGRVWAEDFPRHDAKQASWAVFGPDGRLLGTVVFPSNARVLTFGEREVIMRTTDIDGFNTVAVYRLLDRTP